MKIKIILPFQVDNMRREAEKAIEIEAAPAVDSMPAAFDVTVYLGEMSFSANTKGLVWDEKEGGFVLRLDEKKFSRPARPNPIEPTPDELALEDLRDSLSGWRLRP